MTVKVEWIDKPHIIQLTYSGKLTIEEIGTAWLQLHEMHLEDKAQPFCTLTLIMPDRQLPPGILKLLMHPVLKHLKNTTAAAVVGIDHFLINLIMEGMGKIPFAPKFTPFKTYDDALTYLRDHVRTQTAKVS